MSTTSRPNAIRVPSRPVMLSRPITVLTPSRAVCPRKRMVTSRTVAAAVGVLGPGPVAAALGAAAAAVAMTSDDER